MRGRLDELLSRHADAIIAAAAFVLVALAAAVVPAWDALERRIFDLLTVATAPGKLDQPIVLVAIDEESLNALKLQWPWPRSLHARLIERMAAGGAAVIALDILLAEPSDPAEDAALAKAIAKAGNVVLAADFRYSETALVSLWQRTEPLAAFVEAGAIPGLATVPFDPDQFLRRFPVEPDAFWRQIVKVLQVRVPTQPVPALPEKGAMIRYLGAEGVFDPIPYHLVLEATPEELKAVFDGRIVIVGRDLRATPELGLAQSDLFATPFLPRTGLLTSGMKVHATLVDNALAGSSLRALHPAGNAALAAFAAVLSFLLMRRWQPLRSTAAFVAIAALFTVAAWYLFSQQRLWIAVATPVSVAAFIYLAYGARAYLAEQQRKREVQRAFSRYVSPELVEQIVADPRRLELGGETREITVLFTDLAGFTKLTEKHPPPVVQQVLFRHFSAMTEVILRRKGTVVQFIGDAVMAFWGAPLDDPDHALHAVESAIEMQQAMERLRGELRAQSLPEIHMRIGVNTCVAIVGNMGSDTRFAYTAMGDGINLGSRLEGANKFWKTPILVSGETVAKLRGRIAMRRVDRVRVSGKTEAVDVYTPSTDARLVDRTAAAFDAYVRRDWDMAASLYRELLEENPEDGVARRLLERIEAWRRDPAEASPDGSVALDKL